MREIKCDNANEIIAERFDDALDLLTENAVVFGGAIRDTVAGMPLLGDLDIAVSQEESSTLIENFRNSSKWIEDGRQGRLLKQGHIEERSASGGIPKFLSESHRYDSLPTVYDVKTFSSIGNVKVQIIVSKSKEDTPLKSAIKLAENADLICCCIILNTKGEVYEVIPGAEEDCKRRRIRVNLKSSNIMDFQKCLLRIQHLKDNGWKSAVNVKELERHINKMIEKQKEEEARNPFSDITVSKKEACIYFGPKSLSKLGGFYNASRSLRAALTKRTDRGMLSYPYSVDSMIRGNLKVRTVTDGNHIAIGQLHECVKDFLRNYVDETASPTTKLLGKAVTIDIYAPQSFDKIPVRFRDVLCKGAAGVIIFPKEMTPVLDEIANPQTAGDRSLQDRVYAALEHGNGGDYYVREKDEGIVAVAHNDLEELVVNVKRFVDDLRQQGIEVRFGTHQEIQVDLPSKTNAFYTRKPPTKINIDGIQKAPYRGQATLASKKKKKEAFIFKLRNFEPGATFDDKLIELNDTLLSTYHHNDVKTNYVPSINAITVEIEISSDEGVKAEFARRVQNVIHNMGMGPKSHSTRSIASEQLESAKQSPVAESHGSWLQKEWAAADAATTGIPAKKAAALKLLKELNEHSSATDPPEGDFWGELEEDS